MSENLTLIRANLNSWMTAFNAKDLDGLFSLYDTESVYANAGAPMMVGIPAIREWYAVAFENVDGTLLFSEEKAFAGSDMGLIVGKYYFEPPAGKPVGENTAGRVALLYRKDESGAWKLLFDMDNTPPDVTPADFS